MSDKFEIHFFSEALGQLEDLAIDLEDILDANDFEVFEDIHRLLSVREINESSEAIEKLEAIIGLTELDDDICEQLTDIKERLGKQLYEAAKKKAISTQQKLEADVEVKDGFKNLNNKNRDVYLNIENMAEAKMKKASTDAEKANVIKEMYTLIKRHDEYDTYSRVNFTNDVKFRLAEFAKRHGINELNTLINSFQGEVNDHIEKLHLERSKFYQPNSSITVLA